jgi:excisionase family DNA binding protein
MPDSSLLTPHDAAQYLHVSPRTLTKWRGQGGGPRYAKVGRRVVYRQADLEAWVESQVRTSTSDPGPRATAWALPTRRR